MNILIGADPELFAFDKVNGRYVSVHNLLEGDKKNPVPVKNGAVQVDGTAAEFNITAAATINEFMTRIKSVRTQIESIIQKRNPNIVLVSQPWVEYPKDYWDKEVPEANKELGCDPDYNAYTLQINPRPDPVAIGRPSLRTGSGHVHIGWKSPTSKPFSDEIHFRDCARITEALDKTLLPIIEQHFDSDVVRRELYGKPGAFRPKPYGCEYRVLSNAWVANDDAARVVYSFARAMPEFLSSRLYIPEFSKKDDRDLFMAYIDHYVNTTEGKHVRQFLPNKGK